MYIYRLEETDSKKDKITEIFKHKYSQNIIREEFYAATTYLNWKTSRETARIDQINRQKISHIL